MKKIIIIGALPFSLINFRGELIKAFVANGHKVIAMASGVTAAEIKKIEMLGASYIDYPVQRNGLNPLKDLKTFMFLFRTFKQEKPDNILAYTIKPVIWGGIAATLAGKIKFYGLITGLGFAFQKGGLKRSFLTFLVKGLYRTSLSSAAGIIFQNPDNFAVFTENDIVDSSRCHMVNGSGVDLIHFSIKPLPSKAIFLLIARLLGEKGIREYAAAAETVKQQYPNAIFQLVGPEDSSPDGIPLHEVKGWDSIEYLGATNDVRPYIANCSIFVLPSYHEGMPRTVLEAMATGRPILTTDVPGCRETVVNGVNGFLIQKANSEQLASKMIYFIENQSKWQHMADASYKISKEKFDVNKVNTKILKIIG
ncbi:MAG: glycosyltransferase family 4 protein [Colwellia sp.]